MRNVRYRDSMVGPGLYKRDSKQSTVRYGVYISELRHGRTRGATDDKSGGRRGANLRPCDPWRGRGYEWVWDVGRVKSGLAKAHRRQVARQRGSPSAITHSQCYHGYGGVSGLGGSTYRKPSAKRMKDEKGELDIGEEAV